MTAKGRAAQALLVVGCVAGVIIGVMVIDDPPARSGSAVERQRMIDAFTTTDPALRGRWLRSSDRAEVEMTAIGTGQLVCRLAGVYSASYKEPSRSGFVAVAAGWLAVSGSPADFSDPLANEAFVDAAVFYGCPDARAGWVD